MKVLITNIANSIQNKWGNTCNCQKCKDHYMNAAEAVLKLIAEYNYRNGDAATIQEISDYINP